MYVVCSPAHLPDNLIASHRRVWPPGMGMYSGRVVYFNDAVTESILRIPPGDLEGGDYTIVVQGMGGATQKLLVYLRVSLDLLRVGNCVEELLPFHQRNCFQCIQTCKQALSI